MSELPARSAHALTIRREIEAASSVVVSFPKAGRSWLHYFLARYIAERTRAALDLDAVGDGTEMPPLRFTHEHIDVFGDVCAPPRLLCEDLLRRRQIVVLVRDPRDTLVSYWYQKRLREERAVADGLERFARSPVYGIERISQATALLLDLHDRHPGERLLVTYEGLVKEPDDGLAAILRFALAGRPVDERCLGRALEASSFENMRRWERALAGDAVRYGYRFGSRAGARDDSHFKVRRGEAGGFAREMSAELQRDVARLPYTRALLERLSATGGTTHRCDEPLAEPGAA